MKRAITAAIFLCAALQAGVADDEKNFETVRLDDSTALVVRERVAPPDKDSPNVRKRLEPTSFFEFILVKNGKESPVEEISETGIFSTSSPLQVQTATIAGDKLCFVYVLYSGSMVAACATVDPQGGVHMMKETVLEGMSARSGAGAQFLKSDTGAPSFKVDWYAGPNKPPARTTIYKLNAGGEFVKTSEQPTPP